MSGVFFAWIFKSIGKSLLCTIVINGVSKDGLFAEILDLVSILIFGLETDMRYTSILSLVLFILGFCSPSLGQYEISGNLIDSEKRYPKIILEHIPTMHDLFSADMNNIVNTTTVDSTGYFKFKGLDLPEKKALYRISANDEDSGIGIANGINKNYIIISVNNRSNIHIERCTDITENFSGCTVSGDEESSVIQSIYDDILIPALIDLKNSKSYNSKTKNEFFDNKLKTHFKNCADTTRHMLAALVALGMIDDLEEEYKLDPEYFHQLVSKWEDKTDSPYFNYFNKEILLFRSIHFDEETKDQDINWLALVLGGCLLGALFYIWNLRQKVNTLHRSHSQSTGLKHKVDQLSKKEKEVMQLLLQEKSNKEIATALFIETNTVKSHITKIYNKLDVNSRQELQKAYKQGE